MSPDLELNAHVSIASWVIANCRLVQKYSPVSARCTEVGNGGSVTPNVLEARFLGVRKSLGELPE